MTHTPGPWFAKDAAVLCDNPADPLVICYTDHPTDVCHIGNSPNGGEVEQCYANARLIASAPDMLAALRSALPFVDYHHHYGQRDLTAGEANSLAETRLAMIRVIARATGGEG